MTTAEQHPNIRTVVLAAAARDLDVEPVEYPDGTRTAAEAARAIGCSVGQIVKSLVFQVAGDEAPELVLALVSGANQLDEARLGQVAGSAGAARRVDAEAVRAATGFSIGGVPPVGHARELRTFVDADLVGHDEVWAAAGTPSSVFRLTPDDLLRVTGGVVAELRR